MHNRLAFTGRINCEHQTASKKDVASGPSEVMSVDHERMRLVGDFPLLVSVHAHSSPQ